MKLQPLSQLNWFFKLAPERTLCGLDQLVYMHLFNMFNQSQWAETIRVEDAKLLELMCWYDKTGSPTTIDSIRNAKARLKKKGFIDFETGGRATEYRLIKLYPSYPPSDTPSDTPSDSKTSSNIRVREDVKDEKKKTIACEGKAEEYWREIGGGRLSEADKRTLSAYEQERGMSWVKAVMQEARAGNNNARGLSPKFLMAVLARKKAEPIRPNYDGAAALLERMMSD